MAHFDDLRTDRLVLTRICQRDVGDVRELHGDPDVMATLGGVRTPEQTQTTVEALSQHWDEHGFGPWIARDVGSGAVVGMGGLRRVLVENEAETEIGYALLPRFWGLGLAVELASVAADVGFGVLKLPTLVSFTLPTNVRSRRVMEKGGFRYERDFIYKGYPQVLYRQTRETWLKATRLVV
jgi:ribosomal-protein-alanine N-acetyltransferase